MSYLLSLSQDERDSLLETIVYVDKPQQLDGFMGADFGNLSLINYSQVHEGLQEKYPNLPSPSKLRTGDFINTIDYRGVGLFYAIWLRKGLITHDEEFIAKVPLGLKNNVDQNNPEDQKGEVDEDEQTEKKLKTNKDFTFPLFISRKADGPHNDGKHDCYLSAHPDEMGYSASTAFSSVPPEDYYWQLCDDGVKSTFDPLLTHSKSHYGKIIAQAKESEEYADDEDFPLQYVGVEDPEMGDEELMWVPLEETPSLHNGMPDHYIERLRDLFNRHFDETAEPVDFDAESDEGGEGDEEGGDNDDDEEDESSVEGDDDDDDTYDPDEDAEDA